MVSENTWNIISDIIGWLYFFAWSISFYPQAILNYKIKSVAGFSLEFAAMNPSGFFFYSVYSVGGSVDPWLGTGTVKLNDLVFALHAFFMSSVQLTQIWMYDRGQQSKINLIVVAFLIFIYIGCTVCFIYEATGHPITYNWDTFMTMGYAKAAITFVKYVPQVILNWRRKSMAGFSLANVMLDFTGGSLSMLQIVLNALALDEPVFTGEAFNSVKFFLSIMSIIFDLVFMFQAFVLYPGTWKDDPNAPNALTQKQGKLKILADNQVKEMEIDDSDMDVLKQQYQPGLVQTISGDTSYN